MIPTEDGSGVEAALLLEEDLFPRPLEGLSGMSGRPLPFPPLPIPLALTLADEVDDLGGYISLLLFSLTARESAASTVRVR